MIRFSTIFLSPVCVRSLHPPYSLAVTKSSHTSVVSLSLFLFLPPSFYLGPSISLFSPFLALVLSLSFSVSFPLCLLSVGSRLEYILGIPSVFYLRMYNQSTTAFLASYIWQLPRHYNAIQEEYLSRSENRFHYCWLTGWQRLSPVHIHHFLPSFRTSFFPAIESRSSFVRSLARFASLLCMCGCREHKKKDQEKGEHKLTKASSPIATALPFNLMSNRRERESEWEREREREREKERETTKWLSISLPSFPLSALRERPTASRQIAVDRQVGNGAGQENERARKRQPSNHPTNQLSSEQRSKQEVERTKEPTKDRRRLCDSHHT